MNSVRITQTAATVAELMGFSMPNNADVPNEIVLNYGRKQFFNKPAEKVVLYNPDAIALWLYQKYTEEFAPVIISSNMALSVRSVMPSVTPVCFASMYTGLSPEEHGICSYIKPVLKALTLFDAAISAGKKPIIISTKGDSISEIFKERKMDYIFCDTADECNQKAIDVIKEDRHDLVVIYNGNYDSSMHKNGPESEIALKELKHNINSFYSIVEIVKKVWKNKNTVAAFLPDHGCHAIDGGCGSHGLEMPEDMDIIHFYSFNK